MVCDRNQRALDPRPWPLPESLGGDGLRICPRVMAAAACSSWFPRVSRPVCPAAASLLPYVGEERGASVGVQPSSRTRLRRADRTRDRSPCRELRRMFPGGARGFSGGDRWRRFCSAATAFFVGRCCWYSVSSFSILTLREGRESCPFGWVLRYPAVVCCLTGRSRRPLP